MGKLIAKFSLFCWGFVMVFAAVLIVAMAIPTIFLGIVSIILGAIILIFVGFFLSRNYRQDGLDFGWFFVVKKGYWFVLLGLVGLILFVFGSIAEFIPQIFNNLTENSAMNFAKLLVALFWFALISTFLSWSLICFAESAGYFGLKNLKSFFGSFVLGMLWQIFVLIFAHLFLEVINEVFFKISAANQNWTLISITILSIIAGFSIGKFEDPKPVADEEER